MCSASGTIGAWIQDAKTPNTATEEDTDNKTGMLGRNLEPRNQDLSLQTDRALEQCQMNTT